MSEKLTEAISNSVSGEKSATTYLGKSDSDFFFQMTDIKLFLELIILILTTNIVFASPSPRPAIPKLSLVLTKPTTEEIVWISVAIWVVYFHFHKTGNSAAS